MIRFDKLTLKGQEALQAAQSHAQDKGNPQVAPEHLLWALVEQKEGVVLPVLQKLGVNLPTLARDLADAVAKLPKVQGQAEIYISPALNRVLEDAFKEADQFNAAYLRNGAIPGGTLETDKNVPEAERLKMRNEWNARYGGHATAARTRRQSGRPGSKY